MFSILAISNKYFLLFNKFMEYSVEKAQENSWKFITWMLCDFSPRSTEKALNKIPYFIIRSEKVGYKDVSISSNFLGGLRGHVLVFSLYPRKLYFLSAFVNNNETRISLMPQLFFSKSNKHFCRSHISVPLFYTFFVLSCVS